MFWFLVSLVLWTIIGILVAGIAINSHEVSRHDGPIMNFLDRMNDRCNELSFVMVLIGVLILSVVLWPLVIIYRTLTQKAPQEQSVLARE